MNLSAKNNKPISRLDTVYVNLKIILPNRHNAAFTDTYDLDYANDTPQLSLTACENISFYLFIRTNKKTVGLNKKGVGNRVKIK